MTAIALDRFHDSVPLIFTPMLCDGQVLSGVDPAHPRTLTLFVGTRPLTDLELAGEEARHIVRRGLAAVLEWLGEDVGPAPVREGRGRAFVEHLRKQAS